MREAETDPRAQRFIQELIRRCGGDLYVTHFAEDPQLGMEMLDALRHGEVVALQGDRPRSGGRAAEMRLFGRPFPLPIGPAALARAAGVPIVPVFVFREGRRRYRCILQPGHPGRARRPPASGTWRRRWGASPPTSRRPSGGTPTSGSAPPAVEGGGTLPGPYRGDSGSGYPAARHSVIPPRNQRRFRNPQPGGVRPSLAAAHAVVPVAVEDKGDARPVRAGPALRHDFLEVFVEAVEREAPGPGEMAGVEVPRAPEVEQDQGGARALQKGAELRRRHHPHDRTARLRRSMP